ncbi:fatty acid metabolism regulator protein [Kurthia zopfii]|uniref:Fatty acid metabolism regulator protein n=1 Tax=Kurthia zopfii TaxID=1650 RepID=A0A2U3AEV7_9BACL|nr:TetR/AcrR family transcriptional regulator [Kurthia zopfii]PWI23044.1 TetR family transcriptional regulator [Kurthia zopfii]TDR40504.1 TetR family transcriptional regulator [Kurthia zopfii]STX10243.1 Fatty acid metabolism regulator protein [Kurthia zopfii]VEI08167.1 Fatty acid metabolism regulator protein [Kurthia zopfii]GEK30063.1 fatty acid metabolism regulator protein [Kurthia zopfii]
MKKEKPKYKQIIDAAVVVIADNGYHQAQVSKIAKQAGVADGTIYLYFKNKEDILISVFQEKMSVFIEGLQEIVVKEAPASEKLEFMITNHFSVLSKDKYLARVTQLELRQSNRDIRLKINAVLKEYLDQLDAILEEGVQTGLFAKDMDLRLARQLIFGTIDEVTTSWVMKDHKFDLNSQSSKVYQLLLNGIKA